MTTQTLSSRIVALIRDGEIPLSDAWGKLLDDVAKAESALLAEHGQEPVVTLENLEHFISFWRKAHEGKVTPRKNEIEHTLWFLEGLANLTHPAPSIPAAVPDYYVVVTTANVWQTFCKNRAEAEFIVSKPFNKGYHVLEVYTRRAAAPKGV